MISGLLAALLHASEEDAMPSPDPRSMLANGNVRLKRSTARGWLGRDSMAKALNLAAFELPRWGQVLDSGFRVRG
jgi:hypothetical protein